MAVELLTVEAVIEALNFKMGKETVMWSAIGSAGVAVYAGDIKLIEGFVVIDAYHQVIELERHPDITISDIEFVMANEPITHYGALYAGDDNRVQLIRHNNGPLLFNALAVELDEVVVNMYAVLDKYVHRAVEDGKAYESAISGITFPSNMTMTSWVV